MKFFKVVLNIIGILAGLAILAFFVWLGMKVGGFFGLIKR